MFYIRADANEIIGTGHVMRCLSIAEEMRRQGGTVTFIFADERTRRFVEDKGFSCICLNSAWDDLEKEMDVLSQVIKDNEIESLLIDSYYVTKKYLQQMKELTSIIYIDDLAMFPYPVDMLINYNIFATAQKYKSLYGDKYNQIEFVLGCEYAPLRREFVGIQKSILEHTQSILITSGGTDTYNLMGNLLSRLREEKWFSGIEIHVIIGRFNDNKKILEEEWINYNNVHLHYNISNIVDYMKKCDIAISAGGVTTYELCACGVPTIMYTLADNQQEITRVASDICNIMYVGDIRKGMEECIDRIILKINELLDDVILRERISTKMQSVVDGNGCKRLVDQLSKRL